MPPTGSVMWMHTLISILMYLCIASTHTVVPLHWKMSTIDQSWEDTNEKFNQAEDVTISIKPQEQPLF